MGGTGGLGSDRSSAQSGLQGAGLLAGSSPDADTKLAALGIENAPQPSSGLLAGGSDSVIPKPTGITSLSDTPPTATPVTAPTFNFVPTTIAAPATTAFATAPGTTASLGTADHVPFGTPKTEAPSADPAVTGATIAGGAAGAPAPETPKPMTPEQLWDEWYKAHPGTGYTIGLDDFLAYDLGETRDPYSGVGAQFPERGSWEAPGPARTPEAARVLARQARQLGLPTYDPRITSG